MGLHSETGGVEGERFVTVRKARRGAARRTHVCPHAPALCVRLACSRRCAPPPRARQKPQRGAAQRLSAADVKELSRKARAALTLSVRSTRIPLTLSLSAQATAAKLPREKLSDAAPPPDALASVGCQALNVRKRDLRGIEAVQAELRARKEPRAE
jgi:hypothetical protein